ncbi:MAG: hypothetical protein E7Z90_03065 [Cyanobacteria bacterium SIG29]|nr:hypothetical protein [Cyanobacteria bacterium SIG29]
MARKKSNKFFGAFQIFFASIKTYFLYLDQCAKYLAFPIFGQLISLVLLLTITYFFATNIENIKNIHEFFNNDKHLLTTFYVIIAPFLLVFLKAFFNYLIAFCSLNILFFTNSKSKKSKNIDFCANDNVIKRKLPNYIFLLLIVSLCSIFPPILIFLSLCFQVFALEGDVSAPKAFSRSFELVKDNIIPTIIMIILCWGSTYYFLPELFMWVSEKVSLSTFVLTKLEIFYSLLPIENYNEILSNINMSTNVTELAMYSFYAMLSFVIIGFTLPFRCCCFTELYRMYDSDKIKENSKSTDEIVKRATSKKGKN